MEFLLNRYITVFLGVLLVVGLALAQNETLTATPTAKYLSSPGYPTQYSNNLTYEWLLTSSDKNEVIKIEVPDCEIEYIAGKVSVCQIDKLVIYNGKLSIEYIAGKVSVCQIDKLGIYDGMFDNATVLYDGCCITSVPAMNSSGPNLLLRFTTDTTIVAKGFQIKYYNSGYEPETTAAAFAIFIAIAAIIVVIGLVVAGVAFYIYKLKKTKEQRINPVGGEEAATTSRDDKYKKDYIDEYKKPPLPSDSPVPLPNDWSEIEGMSAPSNIGPLSKPDIINNDNLPDGNGQGNRLPPIQNVSPVH